MPGEPVTFAMSACLGCGRVFAYDPDRVPAVRVQRVNGTLVATESRDHGTAEPVCPACCRRANPDRLAAGLEPFPEDDTMGRLTGGDPWP
jgi:hypothetical protein